MNEVTGAIVWVTTGRILVGRRTWKGDYEGVQVFGTEFAMCSIMSEDLYHEDFASK